MANRTTRKIAVVAVVIIVVTLIIHGINKEYSLTGIVQLYKSQALDGSRFWRDSAQGKEGEKHTFSFINSTDNFMRGNWSSFTGENDIENNDNSAINGANQNSDGAMRIESGEEQTRIQAPTLERTCTRRNNIAFFKMHKCSSSTVQNILMRYGDRFDLNFVLPPAGNYLGTTFFNKRFVQTFPVKEYNILTHHTRFSKTGFDSVMPKETVFVTIIRDPVTMYASTFTYLNYPARYGIRGPNALETFLADPNRYYQPNKGKDHAKDSMLFDLGLENDFKTDERAVGKKIQEIASDFDLVMMTEYFPESLILLKHLMCWDFEDVTYFKMNARSKSSIKTVSDRVADKIRTWNSADARLYKFFNETFWEKVRAFGEDRMRAEVAKLEEMNQMMQERCVETVVVNDKKVWHPAGISVESFKLRDSMNNDTDCVLMTKTELPFTGYIRQKQLAKYFGPKTTNLL